MPGDISFAHTASRSPVSPDSDASSPAVAWSFSASAPMRYCPARSESRKSNTANAVCLSAMCNLQKNDDGANNVRVDDAPGRGPLRGAPSTGPIGSTVPRVCGSTVPRVHGHGFTGMGSHAREPVVVTSPSILTYTKEPHLRSSNLNFFSPTIGVRFSFGREGGRHLAAGAKEKAGRGIRSPCPAFLLSYRGLTSCAARSRFGFRDGGTASIPLPRA